MDHIPLPGLQAGDRLPALAGVTSDRTFYSLEEQYGRPAILILAGSETRPDSSKAIAGILQNLCSFAARNADVLVLVDDNPALVWRGSAPPVRIIDSGDFLVRLGVGTHDTLLLVLDRNMRIALRARPDDFDDLADACLRCLDLMPWEQARDIALPAPILLLPNLLSRELCSELVDRFENSPTMDGEVARIDAAGRVRSVVDHNKKHRRDMAIGPYENLHRALEQILLARCAPQIAKAFQGHVRYVDRILISRYDDTGGHFRRHRDNAAENVAFREFALSVNLNTEDYQGGHLWFPEYNDHRYKPPTGAGAIFSTGVLHEAAPVTLGRRYVLLTFLHSEAAGASRLSYNERTGRQGC